MHSNKNNILRAIGKLITLIILFANTEKLMKPICEKTDVCCNDTDGQSNMMRWEICHS